MIMGPLNVNIGPWNVNWRSCNVTVTRIVIVGPWNVNSGLGM